MPHKIAMVAQKGGVGKSTLARIIAVEAVKGGLAAKIADLDTQQSTSVNWAVRRAENGIAPEVRAEAFKSVDTALKDAASFDLYIFDGAPHSLAEGKQLPASYPKRQHPTPDSGMAGKSGLAPMLAGDLLRGVQSNCQAWSRSCGVECGSVGLERIVKEMTRSSRTPL